MNAIATDARLTAIALADGNETATITPLDVINIVNDMTASALAIADAILTAEGAVETSAKAWGCNYLNLVKIHGYEGDALAERSRKAMGWPNLVGPAGSKVKTRFNTLRSRCSMISGRWDELSDDQRNELLGGVKSVNTVYDELAKADKAAKRAKEAAKAAAEKARETDPANAAPQGETAPQGGTVETIEFDPLNAIELLTLSFEEMDESQMIAIQKAFAEMTAAYDARVNALLDAKQAA